MSVLLLKKAHSLWNTNCSDRFLLHTSSKIFTS